MRHIQLEEDEEYTHRNLWFCCISDNYTDWDIGSYDLSETVEICKENGYTSICVIDDNERDPFCLDELEPSDYFDLTTEQIHNEQSWIAEKYHFVEVK